MKNNMEDLKKIIEETLEREIDTFKSVANFVFNHPELGGEEYESSKHIADVLERYGFRVDFPYESLKTAFVGEYGKKDASLTIAFVAEYDAIPSFGTDGGPGHGCGHSWIAGTMCGCAVVLKELTEELDFKVRVIGTPAEETFGAKYDMIKLGAFDDVDFAFQAHLDEFTSIETLSLAMNSIEFDFKGLAAHAAQNPHKGINALDGVIQMFNGVNAIRQHIKQESRIHGIITYGGEVTNTVPDFAQCRFSIRAKEKGYLKELRKKLLDIANGAALCTGTTVEYRDYENPFDDMINVPSLINVCKKNLCDVGIKDFIPEEGYPGSGSSDIGNVSYVCPTVYLETTLPGGVPVAVHEQSAMEMVNSPEALDFMRAIIKAYAYSVLDIISDEALAKEIKDEHLRICDKRIATN
ncbi:MAG: M20 family metallopeptidase [Filifactoraceae bacterium]